jgi:hypothetical protein
MWEYFIWQDVASEFARAYNKRKHRTNAFWEDNYRRRWWRLGNIFGNRSVLNIRTGSKYPSMRLIVEVPPAAT